MSWNNYSTSLYPSALYRLTQLSRYDIAASPESGPTPGAKHVYSSPLSFTILVEKAHPVSINNIQINTNITFIYLFITLPYIKLKLNNHQ